MRRHSIFSGWILIIIAFIMMGSALGIIPDIPWFKLIVSGFLTAWAVKALLDRDFFGTFMSASIIAWIFDEELMIEHLTPFPLVAAAACLGIGLNMVIGKRKRHVHIQYKDGDTWKTGTVDDVRVEEWTDGREVTLENYFNSTSKYVNSAAFSSAKLENDFGSANVYFTNANVYNGEATIELDNNFGKMNIYIPGKWRATISQNSTFGHVGIFGEPNRDMDAPHVIIKASSNFGELNIFFD